MKVLLSQAQITSGVAEMAAKVNAEYSERPLTILGVMTGSVMLLADLMRQIEAPLRVGVVQASSYEGTRRGRLRVNADLIPDIRGRDVLLVDDIYDTGHTLVEVVRLMKELEPQSIRTAVLLRKLGRQEVDLEPDYAAFEIPDEFVVGYGLDYQDEYRNLPYVACLEDEDIRERA